MVVVSEPVARFAGAGPPVLDAGQTTFVERDRPGRVATLVNDQLVPAHQDDEGGNRREDQPGAEDLLPDEDQGQRTQAKHTEPRIAELAIGARESLEGSAPLV